MLSVSRCVRVQCYEVFQLRHASLGTGADSFRPLVVLFESWVAAGAVLGRVHKRSRAPTWCHSLCACSLANYCACVSETGRTVGMSQCGMGECLCLGAISLI